jgi:pantothenate kinase
MRRRGAAYTFDAAAFAAAVQEIKSVHCTTERCPDLDLLLPTFDHAGQDPVEDGVVIPSNVRIVIVEGNYVLLNEHPWNLIWSAASERYAIRDKSHHHESHYH